MENILNITERNAEDLYSVIREVPVEEALDEMEHFIDTMPGCARALSMLISAWIKERPEIKEKIEGHLKKATDDKISLASRLICAGYMGATVRITINNPVSDVLSGCSIRHRMPSEFTAAATSLCKKVQIAQEEALLSVFSAHAIIQKFTFSKAETLYRLRDKSHQTIIEAMLIKESDADIGIISDMCRRHGFLDVLAANITRFRRRTHIVGIIFLGYFSGVDPGENFNSGKPLGTKQARDCFLSMFTLEAEQFCRRIGSVDSLNKLVGRDYKDVTVPHSKYSKYRDVEFKDDESFFKAFLELSSPTPTHFLSYLEFYEDRFSSLSSSSRLLFLTLLKEFHKGNEPYLEIILPRLYASGLVKE